jgi:hypothetical protein
MILCFYRFHMSAVTKFSGMISWSRVTQLSLIIYGSAVTYRFLQFCESTMTPFLLSIPEVSWHSVFSDDFKFYSESVFADYLWISSDIAFLTIPCVGHDSIFAIDLMRRSWIHGRCRFNTSAGTQYSLTVSRSIGTLFSVTIYRSAFT